MWMKVYLGITSVMALAFSALAYVQPQAQFGAWEALGAAGALSLAGPLGLYIARNLATAAVGLFALRAGPTALSTALLLRAVTDGLDALHNAVGGNYPGVGFAGVMCAVDVVALVSSLRRSAARPG